MFTVTIHYLRRNSRDAIHCFTCNTELEIDSELKKLRPSDWFIAVVDGDSNSFSVYPADGMILRWPSGKETLGLLPLCQA